MLIKDIKHVIGKKLLGAKYDDDGFWLIFDDPKWVLDVKFPQARVVCLGCEEDEERESKEVER